MVFRSPRIQLGDFFLELVLLRIAVQPKFVTTQLNLSKIVKTNFISRVLCLWYEIGFDDIDEFRRISTNFDDFQLYCDSQYPEQAA